MRELGTLSSPTFPADCPRSEGLAINNHGDVVGRSSYHADFDAPFLYRNGGSMEILYPQLFDPDVGFAVFPIAVNDSLSVLSGARGGSLVTSQGVVRQIDPDGEPRALNNNDEVVGEVHNKAFYWDTTTLISLGTLEVGGYSAATAINNLSQVVGGDGDQNFRLRAFLWTKNSGMIDLNTMIPNNSGWELELAIAINDNGQIVGTGVFEGQARAFLLTPTTLAAPSDLTAISCLPGEIRLRWRDNSTSETEWIIERSLSSGPWSELRRLSNTEVSRFPGGTDISFFDTNLARNTAYTYRVRATDGSGVSVPSNEQQARTLDVQPIDPIALNALKLGQAVQVSEWRMTAQVTEHDGLAVHNVTVNKQQLVAQQMSVPFLDLWFGDTLRQKRCELRGDSTATCTGGGRSQLIYAQIDNQVPFALYSLDQFSPDTQSCLLVTQEYIFLPEIDAANNGDQACEGSQFIPFHHPEPPCARFTPRVEYSFKPDTKAIAETFEVRIAQRLHFQNWADRQNVLTVFQDCNFGENFCPPPPNELLGIVRPIEGNPLPTETFLRDVINNGDQGSADNIHQTFNTYVSAPGFDLGGAYAGCPECLHLHWRWSNILLNANFNRGQPLIPPNSLQSVDLAIVNKEDNAEAEDPSFGVSRVALTNPVVWLMAQSTELSDSFFAYDGFIFPATNLAVKVIDAPKPINTGETLTYRVEVANNGPARSASDTELEVNIRGSKFEFVSATPNKGSCSGGTADESQRIHLSCQLGTLAQGETVNVAVTARALQEGKVVSNFNVHGLRPDQNIQNNTVEKQLTVKTKKK